MLHCHGFKHRLTASTTTHNISQVVNGLFELQPQDIAASAQSGGLLHTAIVHIPGGTGNGLSLSLGCSSPLDALVNVFNGRCKRAHGRCFCIGCRHQRRHLIEQPP